MIAGALAHPPRSVEGRATSGVAHPVPAHRVLTRRGRLGAGPVGAVMIAGGAVAAMIAAPVATVWRAVTGEAPRVTLGAHAVVVVAVLVVCAGAWLLHAEGRAAAPAPPRIRPDAADVAAATALLGALSVAADSGAGAAVLVPAVVVVLALARTHGGAGAALATAAGYVAVRGVASGLVGALAGAVPLAGRVVLGAVVVEVLALPVVALRGSVRSARGTSRRERVQEGAVSGSPVR